MTRDRIISAVAEQIADDIDMTETAALIDVDIRRTSAVAALLVSAAVYRRKLSLLIPAAVCALRVALARVARQAIIEATRIRSR